MKVADLKVILQTANVPFDSKLTKQALIKKVLETPAALAVASSPEDNAEADDDLVRLPNWRLLIVTCSCLTYLSF